MAIINSYPKDINIQDKDAWIGTDSHNRQTRQYTAEAVAKYLNVKGKVSIAGQVNYKFVQLPKTGAGTIALTAGGGDGTPFSALTEFKISRTDLSGQVVVAYLNFLLNQDILIVSQTDKEAFGHYTVTSYVVDPINPNFYTIQLFFLGGNGNIQIDDYYDITDLALKESGYVTGISAGEYINIDNPTEAVPTINHDITSRVDTSSADSALTFPVIDTITTNNTGHVTSVNTKTVTVPASIDGSGTTNFVTKWIDADTIGDSLMFDNGTSVGVGHTNPFFFAKLDIDGGLFLADRSTNQSQIFGSNGSMLFSSSFNGLNQLFGGAYSVDATTTTIRNNSSYVININSSNNVGIGTTAPSQKLHVAGNMRLQNQLYDSTNSQGSVGEVLTKVSAGTEWKAPSDIIGGPYLPLAGGTMTGNLAIDTTTLSSLSLEISGTETGRLDNFNSALRLINFHASSETAVQGNGDISLNSVGSNNIKLSTANSERMRITSSGNVGIGTTSPSEKLEVNGNIKSEGAIIGNDSTIYDLIVKSNAPIIRIEDSTLGTVHSLVSNNTELRVIADQTLSLRTNNTARYDIDVSGNHDFKTGNSTFGGNVGIGTTTTGRKLSVNASSSSIVADFRSSSGNNSFVSFSNNASTADQIRLGSNGGNLTLSTNYLERMRILANGNVGIGTTSPIGKLEVQSSVVRTSVNGGADELVLQNAGYSGMTILSSNTTAAQIHFGDDAMSNTGMIQYWNNTNSMTFSTNGGAEKMRITSAGNVGIGTTSPVSKLHIAGNTSIITVQDSNSTGNTATANVQLIDNGTFGTIGTIGFTGDNDLYIQNNHTGNILLDSTGNVGVGTTNPTQKLDVIGNIKANNLFVENDIYHQGDPDTKFSFTNNSIQLYTFGSERMHITSNGNIGIGTTSPGAKLQVSGSGNESVEIKVSGGTTPGNTGSISLSRTDGAGSIIQGAAFLSGGIPIGGISGGIVGSSNTSAPAFAIQTPNSTNGHIVFKPRVTEKMRITASGNVGIGTTSPSNLLDVVGSNAEIVINDTNSSPKLRLRENGYTSAFIQTYLGNLDIVSSGDLNLYSNNTLRATVKETSGNVGIGTANPSQKLEVAGNIMAVSSAITAYAGSTKYAQLSTTNLTINNGGGKVVINSNGNSYLNGGNVGIGITSPGAKLHIKGAGTSYTTTAFRVENANNSNSIRVLDSGNIDQTLTAFKSTSFGTNAGRLSTGTDAYFSAFGTDAGTASTTGGYWTAVGASAGATSTTGQFWNAFGFFAGFRNVTGNYWNAIGANSGENNTNGSNWVAIGSQSARYYTGGTTAASSFSNGVYIGTATKVGAVGAQNEVVIGYQAEGLGSNSVVIGSDSITTTALKGNVGIGTTSPSEKLDVRDGTITSRDSGNVNYAELDRFAGLTLKGNGAGAKYISTPNTDDLGFKTNNTEKMRITSAGNVGIGTTSPTAKFQVDGASSLFNNTSFNGGIRLTPSANPYIGLGNAANGNNYLSLQAISGDNVLDTKGRDFKIISNSGSNFFLNASTGHVGIGTTSPGSKLDVNGIISLGGSQFAEYVANSDLFTIGDIDGAGAELALHTDSGEAVRIDLLGNVGIGTTSPISRLDVSGGDIEVKDIASGIIMKSPDGTRYRVTIANGGALSVAAV